MHWSVEYFIYVPWSSTCVLVVEELGQPHSGRLLLPLQHFMDCLTLSCLVFLSPSQQWFEIKTIVCTQYFTRVSAVRPLSIDGTPLRQGPAVAVYQRIKGSFSTQRPGPPAEELAYYQTELAAAAAAADSPAPSPSRSRICQPSPFANRE